MTSNQTRTTYDSEHDVLYVHIGESEPSHSDEVAPNVWVSFAESNDRVTGITILDYKKQRDSNPCLPTKSTNPGRNE